MDGTLPRDPASSFQQSRIQQWLADTHPPVIRPIGRSFPRRSSTISPTSDVDLTSNRSLTPTYSLIHRRGLSPRDQMLHSGVHCPNPSPTPERETNDVGTPPTFKDVMIAWHETIRDSLQLPLVLWSPKLEVQAKRLIVKLVENGKLDDEEVAAMGLTDHVVTWYTAENIEPYIAAQLSCQVFEDGVKSGDHKYKCITSTSVPHFGAGGAVTENGTFVVVVYAHPDAPKRPASNPKLMFDLTAFQEMLLSYHNKVRAKVHVQPLVICQKLHAAAQAYADHLAKLGRSEHSPNESRPGQGESLMRLRGLTNVRDIAFSTCEGFEEEGEFYAPGTIVEVHKAPIFGHYTQMVWQETKKLGAGIGQGKDALYVVVRYSPAGNIIGMSAFGSTPEERRSRLQTSIRCVHSEMFRRLMLQGHNLARAKVGVAPLQWSPQLELYAEAWASILAEKGMAMRSPLKCRLSQGETLFSTPATNLTPEDAARRCCESFEEEGRTYVHGTPIASGKNSTSNYTQMVWSTTTIFAAALCVGPKQTIVVCRYHPSGNHVGQLPFDPSQVPKSLPSKNWIQLQQSVCSPQGAGSRLRMAFELALLEQAVRQVAYEEPEAATAVHWQKLRDHVKNNGKTSSRNTTQVRAIFDEAVRQANEKKKANRSPNVSPRKMSLSHQNGTQQRRKSVPFNPGQRAAKHPAKPAATRQGPGGWQLVRNTIQQQRQAAQPQIPQFRRIVEQAMGDEVLRGRAFRSRTPSPTHGHDHNRRLSRTPSPMQDRRRSMTPPPMEPDAEDDYVELHDGRRQGPGGWQLLRNSVQQQRQAAQPQIPQFRRIVEQAMGNEGLRGRAFQRRVSSPSRDHSRRNSRTPSPTQNRRRSMTPPPREPSAGDDYIHPNGVEEERHSPVGWQLLQSPVSQSWNIPELATDNEALRGRTFRSRTPSPTHDHDHNHKSSRDPSPTQNRRRSMTPPPMEPDAEDDYMGHHGGEGKRQGPGGWQLLRNSVQQQRQAAQPQIPQFRRIVEQAMGNEGLRGRTFRSRTPSPTHDHDHNHKSSRDPSPTQNRRRSMTPPPMELDTEDDYMGHHGGEGKRKESNVHVQWQASPSSAQRRSRSLPQFRHAVEPVRAPNRAASRSRLTLPAKTKGQVQSQQMRRSSLTPQLLEKHSIAQEELRPKAPGGVGWEPFKSNGLYKNGSTPVELAQIRGAIEQVIAQGHARTSPIRLGDAVIQVAQTAPESGMVKRRPSGSPGIVWVPLQQCIQEDNALKKIPEPHETPDLSSFWFDENTPQKNIGTPSKTSPLLATLEQARQDPKEAKQFKPKDSAASVSPLSVPPLPLHKIHYDDSATSPLCSPHSIPVLFEPPPASSPASRPTKSPSSPDLPVDKTSTAVSGTDGPSLLSPQGNESPRARLSRLHGIHANDYDFGPAAKRLPISPRRTDGETEITSSRIGYRSVQSHISPRGSHDKLGKNQVATPRSLVFMRAAQRRSASAPLTSHSTSFASNVTPENQMERVRIAAGKLRTQSMFAGTTYGVSSSGDSGRTPRGRSSFPRPLNAIPRNGVASGTSYSMMAADRGGHQPRPSYKPASPNNNAKNYTLRSQSQPILPTNRKLSPAFRYCRTIRTDRSGEDLDLFDSSQQSHLLRAQSHPLRTTERLQDFPSSRLQSSGTQDLRGTPSSFALDTSMASRASRSQSPPLYRGQLRYPVNWQSRSPEPRYIIAVPSGSSINTRPARARSHPLPLTSRQYAPRPQW